MIPLADRMRPQTLSEFIGNHHLLNNDKILFKAIKNNQIFSMILWGPPGVGKTSLARLIANETKSDFLEFSAVTTSIVELKKIFESKKKKDQQKPTIVFIDEIHRFNKAQQDAFLPYVENGTITLIGATTENPSFEIIGPLLSRTRIFVLNQLSKDELRVIINRAIKDKIRGLGQLNLKLNEDSLDLLLELSGGDARKGLNALEIAVSFSLQEGNGTKSKKIIIDRILIEEAYQHKALIYDKSGEEHYDAVSAYIKSMRASNVDASLYYLSRMVEAGEDPLFIARRMVIFAAEDIGLAQPTAIVVANEVFKACDVIGYPECQINLAFGTAYLAQAKKNRSAYEAYFRAVEDVKTYGNLPIPLHLRNAPTKLMKDLGYGKGYKMYPDDNKSMLPEKLKGKKYFVGGKK